MSSRSWIPWIVVIAGGLGAWLFLGPWAALAMAAVTLAIGSAALWEDSRRKRERERQEAWERARQPRWASDKRLIIGEEVSGEPFGLDISQKSAAIVGGMPGSGKSVLLRTMGKALGDRAEIWMYEGTADDTEEGHQMLTYTQKTMHERLRRLSDYWSMDKIERPKLHVLVLDEAQSLFTPVSSKKEHKDAAADRVAIARDLVQRGRKAGIFLVLATQRPVAESIPTGIRDLAGVRICGRVAKPADFDLIFGFYPTETEFNPMSLRRGHFLVDDGSRAGLRELRVLPPRRQGL